MNKLFILGLCLVCSIVYFNSLKNEFILDDYHLIVDNPFIKSHKLLPQLLKTSLYDYMQLNLNKMYRPLQLLSYAFEFKIWGLRPWAFRLINILLHLSNSILIYYLFSVIFNRQAAKIASILFLVHPLQISVVAYIAGRADLLVSFFMLFSMILFIKFRQSKVKRYYLVSIACALFALLCRENALLLFLFLLLILFFTRPKRIDLIYIIPFIILDLCYIFLRFLLFGSGGLVVSSTFISLPLRLINFFNILLRYLAILLLPLDLHFFRTTPFINELFSPRTILVVSFFLLSIYLAVRFRKNRLFLFNLSWFIIGLLPVFFCFDGYIWLVGRAVMAESWAYLPSAAIFACFIFLKGIFKDRITKIVIVVIIAYYGLLTVINNNLWKNNIIFYSNTLEYAPGKILLRTNLIREYLRKNLYEDAWEEIKKFVRDFPESEEQYLFQGVYYYTQGEVDLAIVNFNLALSKNKNNPEIYLGLSFCYRKLGQLEKAINFALQAVRLNPYYFSAFVQLGDLYSEKKQFSEAKKYYQLALELEPQNKMLAGKIKDAE